MRLTGAPSSAFLLLMLQLSVIGSLTLALNQTVVAPTVPALIVFGDSIVDPGNNNGLSTTVKCDFPPYGKDFAGHQPTGRFSNGRIPSDFMASRLGIKENVPAYLGTELTDQDLLTGVSFASGGCGYDPLTGQLVTVLTMDDQLNLFIEYKEKINKIAGQERAEYIISKSIYLVITGTDDLANTYFSTPFRANYDLPSYINFVVQSASGFFQRLYSMGARKISVASAPPIGCLPSQRTLAGGLERECVDRYNRAAMTLNSELTIELQRLNDTLPGSRFIFIDMYTPLLDIMSRPSAYGFEESTRGCCGTGTFEVTLTCNSITTSLCDEVDKYVFWDSYHPTERAYSILMSELLQRYNSSLN